MKNYSTEHYHLFLALRLQPIEHIHREQERACLRSFQNCWHGLFRLNIQLL